MLSLTNTPSMLSSRLHEQDVFQNGLPNIASRFAGNAGNNRV
jgi:hypothetical protein